MGLSKHPDVLEEYRKLIPRFKCLGDEVRASILITLSDQGELNVNELTQYMDVSRPTVSHHLLQLKQAGLVDFRKEGNERYYYITFSQFFDDLDRWIQIVRVQCSHLGG
ncbi:MAG: metalloregulator ArsR/SmtB family transcription factor [Clostridium sp.]